MNNLVNILTYLLVIVEYFSFFYVIYGKRRQDKWHKTNYLLDLSILFVLHV